MGIRHVRDELVPPLSDNDAPRQLNRLQELYHLYQIQTCFLHVSWQLWPTNYTHRMKMPATEPCILSWSVGHQTGTYCLDDMRFTPTNSQVTPNTLENQLWNASFEEGMHEWNKVFANGSRADFTIVADNAAVGQQALCAKVTSVEGNYWDVYVEQRMR